MAPTEPKIYPYEPAKEYYFKEGCHILESLNDPEDETVSIVRARVEPGVMTMLHALKETVERYVILQGKGEVHLGAEGGILKVVTEGDIVLIPAECPQQIQNTGTEQLVFLAICSPRFRPEVYVDLSE